MSMWPVPVAIALSLTTLAWPAASGAAHLASVQAQVGGLEADFDGDGFVDLAIGVAFEDIAGAADAGAVSVVYGSAGGLTAAGGQAFWQGTGGTAGTAEAGDLLGLALVGGALSTGSATPSASPSPHAPTPAGASQPR